MFTCESNIYEKYKFWLYHSEESDGIIFRLFPRWVKVPKDIEFCFEKTNTAPQVISIGQKWKNLTYSHKSGGNKKWSDLKSLGENEILLDETEWSVVRCRADLIRNSDICEGGGGAVDK